MTPVHETHFSFTCKLDAVDLFAVGNTGNQG